MSLKKRKILFLHIRMVIGGAETILLNYVKLLSQKGYDVDVAFMEGSHNVRIEEFRQYIEPTFLLNEIETQFSNYCRWALNQQELSDDKAYFSSWENHIQGCRFDRLLKKINDKQYDVIIDFQNTSSVFWMPEQLSQIKTPLIIYIHSKADFTRWLWNERELQRNRFKYVDGFISICEDMKIRCENILSHDFAINKPCYMNYNPLDIEKVLVNSEQEVDEHDRVLLNSPFILQVARLDERQKNHLKMIEIFHELKKKGIEEKLYILGDVDSLAGNSHELLVSKIKELQLENECLLIGGRKNPMPFMKNARLFIHTANYEGLPTVLIESMICGVPVVAFDCPTGPREILADGQYGGLIPMDNDELFIETAFEILKNEHKRAHYVSLLPKAVERFSCENVGDKFCHLIEEFINVGKVN